MIWGKLILNKSTVAGEIENYLQTIRCCSIVLFCPRYLILCRLYYIKSYVSIKTHCNDDYCYKALMWLYVETQYNVGPTFTFLTHCWDLIDRIWTVMDLVGVLCWKALIIYANIYINVSGRRDNFSQNYFEIKLNNKIETGHTILQNLGISRKLLFNFFTFPFSESFQNEKRKI